MQSLSSFCSKGAVLVTAHLDSDRLCYYTLRRKRRWFAVPALELSCSCNFGRLSSSGIDLTSGYFADGIKLSFFVRKSSPFDRNFGVVMALEQETVGDEHFGSQRTSMKPENVFEIEDGAKQFSGTTTTTEKHKAEVRALVSCLHNAKTADDVEDMLKNQGVLPLPVYSSMIRGLGSDQKLDAAFAIVEWLKRREEQGSSSISPNLFIYNSLLSAVKQTEQFKKVNEVMEDMKLQGIIPNIVSYNTLMSIYLEQGKANEALNLLAVIENCGLSPSPVTYSTVLQAYKKMEDAKGALRLFVMVREKHEKGELGKGKTDEWGNELLKLENFTIRICYLVMRQWLMNEENPTASVLNLLSYMDEARVKPARTDYERLVWACTREDHYTVTRELYRRIRESDGEISLSVCNHVIWVMGKAKKWWAALEIYEDLLDKGPKPNNLSFELVTSHFNILLTAARRRGIWRWGVRLLNKMQDKGLRPGCREWNAVLVACSKASETSTAVQIFRRMVEQGEKPNILSYGALLSALEKGKLYDEALRVWDHMCKLGVKPNLHAYTILASVYIGKGNPEKVDSIFREMMSSGIEPTVITFNAVITGCAKKDMGGVAFEWFHRMKVQNIKPNEITYEMLIEALLRDEKLRIAYEMYLRAYNEGLRLSSKSYDSVVDACRACGAGMNLNALGRRPVDKKKNIVTRKNMSEFCHLADLPRRGKPFDKSEIYTSLVIER